MALNIQARASYNADASKSFTLAHLSVRFESQTLPDDDTLYVREVSERMIESASQVEIE